jgi:deltex-like protein
VLALLVKAFERRHTFIVGTSVTTGKKDTVVWSGIHHKTNTHGGSSEFGYPDESYLNRVTLELADRGVTLENHSEEIAKVINGGKGKLEVK